MKRIHIQPRLERTIEDTLGQKGYPIKYINLRFTLNVAESASTDDEIFYLSDGLMTISPFIVPDKDHLINFYQRLKRNCPTFKELTVVVSGCSEIDFDRVEEIMSFGIYESDDDETEDAENYNSSLGIGSDHDQHSDNSDDDDKSSGSGHRQELEHRSTRDRLQAQSLLSSPSSSTQGREIVFYEIVQTGVDYLFDCGRGI